MPRYVSKTRAFVNGNIIDQVPGKGAPGSSGSTGPPGSGAALYVQAVDPGAVGPNSFWAKTGGVENALYVRDPTNSAWLLIFSPPQWTVGANGEVVATVDDPTKTPIEVVGLVDQSEALLTLTADTPVGTTDVFLIRQSAGAGGADILTVDDSGEMDLHVVDPGADGLKIDEGGGPGLGVGRQLVVAGDMTNRNELVEVLATSIGGVVGVNTQTLFDGGLRFALQSFGQVLRFDPVLGTTRFTAHTGQTDPLVAFQADDSITDVGRVMPDGLIISNAQTLPDVADLAVGDHGSISDPAEPSITRFLKDSAGTLRTEEVSFGVPDYTQSFLLAGV